jgi:hypothetical protein
MELKIVNKTLEFASYKHGCGKGAILRIAGFFYSISKVGWTDRVRNEELSHRTKGERDILRTIKGRKTNLIGHILRRNCLLKHLVKEDRGMNISGGKTRKKA